MKTHLTRTRSGWCLIHQGQPLTRETATLEDCKVIAKQYRLTIPLAFWSAELGGWMLDYNEVQSCAHE